MKISLLILLSIIPSILSSNYFFPYFNNSAKTNQQIEYKDCIDFKFEVNSENCKFIKKLNSDIIILESNNNEYYITRYINDSTKKIASYDIEGYNEGEFIYVNYSKEIEEYLIYLEKTLHQIIINTRYD